MTSLESATHTVADESPRPISVDIAVPIPQVRTKRSSVVWLLVNVACAIYTFILVLVNNQSPWWLVLPVLASAVFLWDRHEVVAVERTYHVDLPETPAETPKVQVTDAPLDDKSTGKASARTPRRKFSVRRPAKAQVTQVVNEWNLLTDDQKIDLMRAAPELYATVARFVRATEIDR